MKKGTAKVAISVFLIAFAFGLNITGIAPILGILKDKYSDHGTSAVQLLQTLPYILLMGGSLLIGKLTTRFSKRNLAMFGLSLIGIFGILPVINESYEVLLIARIMIGLGFGLTSPLNTAIIAEFFLPEERAGFLGLHVVGMGIGCMVGNIVGGILAGFSFRLFYLVYAVAFISMIGVFVLLPNIKPDLVDEGKSKVRLNSTVYSLSAASFVHTLFITVYSTNISMYILGDLNGSTAMTGLATAVNAAFALIVGAGFAKISGLLKEATLFTSVIAAVIGYGSMTFIGGMAGVYICSAAVGASLSCFMAQCSYLISVSVESEAVASASGVFSVIGGIGGLLSPVIMGEVTKYMNGGNTPVNQFLISSAGMLVLAVTVVFAKKSTSEKRVVSKAA
ncbi:MAG: MFS transporter [Lachnospiraceae bacterium]|nr:MFS transporter [Lachnospiraceae bacterium]